MFVPTDDSISVKEYNRIGKYKDLEIEIAEMWYLKTNTILITVREPWV